MYNSSEDGERSFSFARKHGADTQLRFDEIPDRLLSETQVLHFGTIAMTDEPERTAQLKSIDRARSFGALLSFDPNYRDTLWGSAGQFVRCTRELLSAADLVKISEEEMELVTGETDPGRAIEYLLGRGAKIAAVTLGKRGAIAGSRTAGLVYREGRRCEPLDATGAGDAFWGGFLSAMLAERGRARTRWGTRARRVAGLCQRRRSLLYGAFRRHQRNAYTTAAGSVPRKYRVKMNALKRPLVETGKGPHLCLGVPNECAAKTKGRFLRWRFL